MEIHTPERPPLSMKEFGIQLATITIGILIALSLEGVTQWFHHRSLVREARANLASELRDNKAELDRVLHAAPASEKDLRTALQLIDDILAHRKSDIHTLSLSYNLALFNTASRSTAASWAKAELTSAASLSVTRQARIERSTPAARTVDPSVGNATA